MTPKEPAEKAVRAAGIEDRFENFGALLA